MTDFNAYRLSFGGVALEPLTHDAETFLSDFQWEDSTFRQPVPCMEGLPENAVGFEPFLVSEIIAEIKERGLTSKAG